MTSNETVSRRSVLRTSAAAAGVLSIGTPALLGQAAADTQAATLQSKIENHGHYAWFPKGPETWGRSASPFDIQDGESQWLAQPDSEGRVRCLGKNLGTEPPNRNAGFDIHLGRLSEIETVTVTAHTLQTARTTGPALLFIGLYLDQDKNGEFFTWEAGDGMERFAGVGGDDEGVVSFGANGTVTISSDTVFTIVGAETEATLAELQDGSLEGVSGTHQQRSTSGSLTLARASTKLLSTTCASSGDRLVINYPLAGLFFWR